MSIKIKTQDVHFQAENSVFNTRLAKGELTSSEYLFYLYQLKAIFSAIEQSELPHKDMYRSEKIEQDIQELKQLNPNLDLYATSSVNEYVKHLNSLDSNTLLPHIYTNYFAILFGGQMIKQNTPGSGVMYDFANKDDVIKTIRSLEQDEWEQEVRIAFEYNIKMANDIQAIFN